MDGLYVVRIAALAALATLLSPSVNAQEAFLNYTQPFATVSTPGYIAQVENYPAFRPVSPPAGDTASSAPEPASAQSAAQPEPEAEENVILNVGGSFQVVPRARISDN
ncbi:hypothetical protein [Roseivivax halotolerans]|uniref:hypothetical protein n=1 Tax=Roseivivax halotolerans TaxID=93684 RepID=UPI00111463EC|nr:hypothetical protein [Roseivivax halotolerans]